MVTISNLPHSVLTVCRHITASGGKAWLVGGCVRDLLLGFTPKDFDIEAYGLSMEQLEKSLGELGRTGKVGAHFGILKLWLDNLEIDVALPRTEIKTEAGHRGFSVAHDPHLSPEHAAARRDFTINAMMFDPLANKLLDLHGGERDLENRVLKHVSLAFAEDPLRPLRAMQFAARFQLRLDSETSDLCRQLLTEANTLPTPRIWGEWQKWSHAPHPSFGLQVLQDTGWLDLYPDLKKMVDCPQEPRWHPEGSVWQHTLHVCDQASQLATENNLNTLVRERLMFAALCHDVGKPACTFVDTHKRLRSPGHCQAGVDLTENFFAQIGTPKHLVRQVLPLVREHLVHMHGQPTDRAIRRLANRLSPANIELWEMLVQADASGRPPLPPSRPAQKWLERALELKHHKSKPEPILNGNILIRMGIKPGPRMGRLLRKAYSAQLDGLFLDEPSAIAWFQEKGLHIERRPKSRKRSRVQ